MSDKVQVLNPVGYPPQITQLGMAERPDTLEGKTVYLVDMRFDDSDRLLRQMQDWFAEHMPQVKSAAAAIHAADPTPLRVGDAVLAGQF